MSKDINKKDNEALLSVSDLSVEVALPHGSKEVLSGLSFDLLPGEVLCLAGESGSGKSITALAIMGLLPAPVTRISAGTIKLAGEDLALLDSASMRRIRAKHIAMIFQEPMTSLNPLMRIGDQLAEVLIEHNIVSRSDVDKKVISLLADVKLPTPERQVKMFPHELSGGMRQRVMIAMALACDPKILIADEPTTALDVTVQAEILELIRNLQEEKGTSVIMITHDFGVVAEMADRVIVMKQGQMVESAPVLDLFENPQSSYTKSLLAAVPRIGGKPGEQTSKTASDDVLSVNNLCVRFSVRGGLFNRQSNEVRAVENVSFSLKAGETLAVVGESGSGKSTIGKALMSLIPYIGEVNLQGENLALLSKEKLRLKRRHIQMIFQDPYASLDPRMSVGDQVAEPMVIHNLYSGSELTDRVEWLFHRVGLTSDQIKRHPHEFSGGQRQRVCIARALALNPSVIVADECVSALDVSVQAQVLELLQELQSEQNISYLFISHDMAVVENISDRIAVLYAGQIVEFGSREQVFGNPSHSYTQRLLSAVPIPDPTLQRKPLPSTELKRINRILPKGSIVPDADLRDIGNGHMVATTHNLND